MLESFLPCDGMDASDQNVPPDPDASVRTEPPFSVAERFNECVTRADLAALALLMASDHEFIDPSGVLTSGKAKVLAAWRAFCVAFPGYRNEFVHHVESRDTVSIRGRSHCNDVRLDGPALWRVVVRDGEVRQWHVLDDTAENRHRLGL